METLSIPLVRHLGIEEHAEDRLSLQNLQTVHNHVGTMHAAALFALAETQSGVYLQRTFPVLSESVLPLLRGATIKYRQPATGTVYASAVAPGEALKKFETQFRKKGRAGIVVAVRLTDAAENVMMTGEFHWFVQRSDKLK